ncbi:hypothetical protein MIMGU_mgv1a0204211mg, partial [Erythranthe guttata]
PKLRDVFVIYKKI